MPMEELREKEMIGCYWVISQLIGRTVAQKWDGTMIYEVTDTGLPFSYGVRGSYTNVELVFHNDNAFGISLPKYVSLFCKNPAKEGGVSRFCSLYSIHNRMLEKYPQKLERLYQPMMFDRQKEHADGAPKTVTDVLGHRLWLELAMPDGTIIRRQAAQLDRKCADQPRHHHHAF